MEARDTPKIAGQKSTALAASPSKLKVNFHCPSGLAVIEMGDAEFISTTSAMHEVCGVKISWFSPTKLVVEKTWAAGREGDAADHCALHLTFRVTGPNPRYWTYDQPGKSTVRVSQ